MCIDHDLKIPPSPMEKNKFIQTKFGRKHTIFTMNIKLTFGWGFFSI